METIGVAKVEKATNVQKQVFGIERFFKTSCNQDEQELQFYRIQRSFRFYKSNLYILNRVSEESE